MKALIDEYGAAVAARVSAALGFYADEPPLLIAARAREKAAREALDDAVYQAGRRVAEAITNVEAIVVAAPEVYSDDPKWGGPVQNFDRPSNARRKFTLKDAKPRARYATRVLREAWEVLDPSLK